MGWQKAAGYNWRALIEADISRYKRVIGDALRSRTDAGAVANCVEIRFGVVSDWVRISGQAARSMH
jgi:hypothetical protein